MLLIYLFLCLLMFSSGIILYQDFKQRLVSLWVLVLFGVTCICSVIYFRDVHALIYNGLFTLLYLLFVLGMLKLYLYLKFKRNVVILDEQIGLADVLVIFFIGLTFNSAGLIFFFCFAFIGALLSFIIYTIIKKNAQQTIPLAGLLVFFYLSSIVIIHTTDLNYIIDCSFVNP